MKSNEYKEWLYKQKYHENTIKAQLHRTSRVEELYGNLDEHFQSNGLSEVIAALSYSMSDKRANRPNPTKIMLQGDLYNNLASYRDAINRYRNFLHQTQNKEPTAPSPKLSPYTDESFEIEGNQRIGLERDMQAALRVRIDQLEQGLQIIDEGAERSVESGFIDITARDSEGSIVVIELKTGTAGQRAIAQILSYMGDIAYENSEHKVRGILVAAEFDTKAKSAARVIPNLLLKRYSVNFRFCDGSHQ